MYCVTAMLPHARDSAPDAVRRRHARHHAGAHAGPDKHRQWHGQRVTPALVVPYAAFGLSSVPSSRLDTRACCALRYHPQYVPCPQWGPQSFLTAGAAFISFSYATTIYCPRRTPLGASPPRHRRPQHLRQPLSTAHAAFVASLPILMILSAVPPPPLEPAPGTPRTRHAPPAEPAEPAAVVPVAHAIYVASPFAATVFSVAPPSRSCQAARVCRAPTQHTLQLFPTIRAAFAPSLRAPTICSVGLPSPLGSPACKYLGTVPALPMCAVCAAGILHGPRRVHFIPAHRSTPAPRRTLVPPLRCAVYHERRGRGQGRGGGWGWRSVDKLKVDAHAHAHRLRAARPPKRTRAPWSRARGCEATLGKARHGRAGRGYEEREVCARARASPTSRGCGHDAHARQRPFSVLVYPHCRMLLMNGVLDVLSAEFLLRASLAWTLAARAGCFAVDTHPMSCPAAAALPVLELYLAQSTRLDPRVGCWGRLYDTGVQGQRAHA